MTERPHKRLHAWQSSMELVKLIYRITERFPDTERFGLVSQLRRAAVSIPANLAEGAARQSSKEQIQFYYIARGSVSEVDTLVELSQQLGLIASAECQEASKKLSEVSSLLQGLITHSQRRSLCREAVLS